MIERTPYTALISEVANEFGLPADLLEAQVLVESGGDPNAFRYEHSFYTKYLRDNEKAVARRYGPIAACSCGLLQIVVEVAYELGFEGRPEDLFTDRIGLHWGARKMRALWAWAGGLEADYPKALSAYNGGARHAVGPPFPNQTYVDRIYRLTGRTSEVTR